MVVIRDHESGENAVPLVGTTSQYQLNLPSEELHQTNYPLFRPINRKVSRRFELRLFAQTKIEGESIDV